MEMLIDILSGGVVLICFLLFVWFISSAHRRSRQLLRAVLSLEEYRQLMQRGYVDIASPSSPQRVYRVPKAPGFVSVIENEQLQRRLCLQPCDWVPDADFVVIHKLMIEADEQTYIQKANWIIPTMFPG